MEMDEEELENWKARLFAALVFSTRSTEGVPNFPWDVDADFLNPDDEDGPLVPVRPKRRPPFRSSGIALPEPDF